MTSPDTESATAPLLTADGEPLPYADALLELEEILSSLEGSAADVDTLAEKVGRAAALVAYCRSRLDVVRADVAAVVDDLTGDAT